MLSMPNGLGHLLNPRYEPAGYITAEFLPGSLPRPSLR